jgi:hypothetical protein
LNLCQKRPNGVMGVIGVIVGWSMGIAIRSEFLD